MTDPTTAPAPLTYTPYDYTPQGIKETWVRGFVFPARKITTDFTGAVEAIGLKKASAMMREEARNGQ
jgi:hypothetical protein